MTTLETNKALWGRDYAWTEGGEEWSAAWGNSDMQWRWSILPRIEPFLPAGTILEIAPGFGRWTEFLRHHCGRLIGVDLNANCVTACRSRFEAFPTMQFFENDGSTLPMVGEGEVDLAFSFDSLVHADMSVLESYLHELSRVLATDGVAVLHHSNLAPYSDEYLSNKDWSDHGRDHSVSASLIEETASAVGLKCFVQELFPWGSSGLRLTDCLSFVAREGTPFADLDCRIENVDYMAHANLIRGLSAAYGQLSSPPAGNSC